MKKIIIGLLATLLVVVGSFFFFPELFFLTAWGQKFILEMEGEQVANFYFEENQGSKDTLFMKGVIYSNTLDDIKEALDENPEVKTLVMVDVPGSVDDEINLLASQEIRLRGINTYLPLEGMVASGGTDMFLAGKERAVHETAKLGVHSWSGGEKKALEYPRNHEEHKKYLDFYNEMDIPASFYWYTLEAAPADSIHWMTLGEMGKYQITTKPLDLNRMLSIQQKLSSDEFTGRGAGDNQQAQELILSYFESIELRPFENGYEYSFSFNDENTGEERTGTNLVGYVEGNKYPDEYFVIGAHYDHLGIVNDTIYNGADDNASGTSALLVLAKYFSMYPPEHSLIFVAFDAEEQGLIGSDYFVENPPVPFSSMVMNFNFDMISRNPKNEIYVVGTYPYPQFRPVIEELALSSSLTVSYGHDDPNDKTKDYWMYSSDNGPFFEKDIPTLTFSEEDHPGYHQPGDDFEFVNQDFFKKVVLLIKQSIDTIDRSYPSQSEVLNKN